MAGGVEGAPSASIDSSLSSEGLKELPTLNKRDLYLFTVKDVHRRGLCSSYIM